MSSQAGWAVTDSQDNALATATKAADGSKQHIISGFSASFSAAPGAFKLLQIKAGVIVVWERYIQSEASEIFPDGIAIAPSGAASAELAASGTGGTIGKVNLYGITR